MWAKVRDVEEELGQENSNIAGIEKKLEDCKQNAQKRNERVATIQNTIRYFLYNTYPNSYWPYYTFRTLEQQILEIKEQIEIQKRPQVDIRNQIDEMSRHYSEKKREIQQIQTTIQAKTNDIKSLEGDIAASNEKWVQMKG